MPGIHRLYPQTLQSFATGSRRRHVVDNRVHSWIVPVYEQVAAKQVATGCYDSY